MMVRHSQNTRGKRNLGILIHSFRMILPPQIHELKRGLDQHVEFKVFLTMFCCHQMRKSIGLQFIIQPVSNYKLNEINKKKNHQ